MVINFLNGIRKCLAIWFLLKIISYLNLES
jgi:hypothetical protein